MNETLDYAIEIDDVTKRFGEHEVLKGITFKVPRNKITTILGFSGAGKSTLIKHILGLIQPTTGTVKVLGQDLSTLSRVELREFRREFGMLFQYAALFDYLDAFENVAFPLREFDKLSEDQLHAKVAQLLNSVDIDEESFTKLPSELSGGMRKRVGLARALALNPHIMLYDEPTTGLDPITTKKVNQLIKATSDKNKDRGLTSVIISHDVRASLEISDYVAFLERGRIIEYLPTDRFKKSQNPKVQEFLNL